MPAPDPRSDAARILLGFGNTVDYEVEWVGSTVSGLMREHRIGPDGAAVSAVSSETDLLRSLLGHLIAGTGGEHYVESAPALLDFAARFPMRVALGGTNIRAALAMRSLGLRSTVHLVSTGDATRRLLPDGIGTLSSGGGDSLDPHVIVQFPAGARIDLDGTTVVAPRANRVIYVNDRPNRELPIADAFGPAAATADVILASGFNSIQDPSVLSDRLARAGRDLSGRRPGALAVYEHGGFHVSAHAIEVRRRLGPVLDVWSCNEDELQDQAGRELDLLSPVDVLAAARAAHAQIGAATLVVHSRYWALALGGDAGRRRAMLFGGVALAGARYAYGDDVTAERLVEASRWPSQPEGVRFAAGIEELDPDGVSCIAAYRIDPASPTTIGLGDAFVGGVVAALARREPE